MCDGCDQKSEKKYFISASYASLVCYNFFRIVLELKKLPQIVKVGPNWNSCPKSEKFPSIFRYSPTCESSENYPKNFEETQ